MNSFKWIKNEWMKYFINLTKELNEWKMNEWVIKWMSES